MLALWLASLAVIYIPDLPGGVAVPIFAGCLGIFMGNAPQVSLFKLIAPSLAAVSFGGVIYLFIMPRLSSFAGLGPVIFVATFAICYLFFERKQVLGRAFGLIMFMAVTSISNTQSYSFLSVLDTGLMLVVVLLIISVTSYVPVYLRPDRAILRLLARFFRSSAYATRAVAAGRTEQSQKRLPRRDAFHARELAMLSGKVADWKPWVDTKALPGTPSNAIQALADSTAFLSRALTTLVTRVRQIGSPNVGDVLGGDLSAWHAALMQALGKLADDPTLGRVEPVQQHLTEITTRLEARIRDAVDAGQSDSLAPEQREELYLLLAAYRGVSAALMDYVETTASIDWNPWRQERFA